VVIDTNVFVSFLLREGSTPWLAVAWALEWGEVVLSAAQLAELHRVLARDKFDPFVSRAIRARFLSRIAQDRTILPSLSSVRAAPDPEDDMPFAAAADARCRFLVTGDRALLSMGAFATKAIVTPAEFLARVERRT
jgi:putative PIN family toxin of toxin-antitoxin system